MMILENIFDLSKKTLNLSNKNDYTLIMAFLLYNGWLTLTPLKIS